MVEITTGVAVSSCGNVCFATLAAVTENCLLVSVTFSNVSFMFPSCNLSFTFFPVVCIAFRFSFFNRETMTPVAIPITVYLNIVCFIFLTLLYF
ncbi:conserved hypothetical protein [Bacillus anthracis str. Ames]|uniref:Transmembrane protein n=2 Tax=Bacillus anthracis TaxID=1392 RepID=Q81NL7_BACAN|nr:conserved hypothetical protein [Bacillus anthracis str. Ames]AAT32290.2 conserved hypothetical protein [Bacillus anthracis str. 'Ames Ancestor']EDR21002.1 conserved hypothetical protein [Bacillus anthracis str. A0488]EDR89970.1 conserved hypothetical protein [Bacillus anthracis str. A0193]EDR95635.1 conserved hypothetical protein [Bacillus anthracis str. A0442]EDS98653.1 conserved hypothetical protein [Bacillus anthracis str. A0389]EDT22100.1 conserved hypothetical protein [Bacillus anthra